jgi:tetratricopeptide (TPR) repeat protein
VGPEYLYHYEQAQQLARAGAHDRARDSYRASLAAEPNAPALFGLAVLDLNAGNPDSAYAALAQARELAPGNAEIEAHLGAARLMQQRPAEARIHLDRAIALDPDNLRARTNRAMALDQLGAPARALDDLVAARRLATDTSRIDAMIAGLTQRAGLPSPGAEAKPSRESGAG